MKLLLHNISIDKRVRFQELIKNAYRQGSYLSAYIQNPPKPNYWLIGFCLIFILFVFFVNSWSLFYFLFICGPILAYIVFRQTELYLSWRKLGKDSVFFDDQFFVSIENKTLIFIPLTEFKYSDIILSSNERYYIIRFHFDSISIVQPCNKKDEKTYQFQSLLNNYIAELKPSTTQNNYGSEITFSFIDKLMFQKNAIMVALILAVILWFALPNIIDSNDFKYAKGINTATSFRTYLSETKNVKFRDEARNQINKIYDKYILKYKNALYSSSDGAKAFIETLMYLRDKNLYDVNLQFISESRIENIYTDDTEFNVIPIEQSFTKNKNTLRENEVFNTLKSSLGQIFPADIFNLSSTENTMIPKFEVHYVYKNSSESIYYRTEEKNLPDDKKTWYYGIEIEWWFKIILPSSSNAIYEFNLKSEPANQFNSESFNTDAVYTNMAISAFNDFKDEFNKQFLTEQ